MPEVIVNKNGLFIDTHVRYRTISDNLSKQEYKFLLTTTLTISAVDTFVLRRYKCTVCGRVHLELPDIMVPHKHYSRSAIIDTINGERNCSAEQSTIYRWNREKMQLERLLVQVEDKSPEAKRTDGDNNCRCAGN